MTYSPDFRKKVLSIQKKEGLSCQQVARRFSIGTSTVICWQHNPEAKKHSIRKPRKVDTDRLAQDVNDYPDAFQYERTQRFGGQQSTPCAALALPVKKTLQPPKADAAQRTASQLRMKRGQAKGRQIIDLDESGFAHDMPRTHGYTPRGERCYG